MSQRTIERTSLNHYPFEVREIGRILEGVQKGIDMLITNHLI